MIEKFVVGVGLVIGGLLAFAVVLILLQTILMLLSSF